MDDLQKLREEEEKLRERENAAQDRARIGYYL